MSILGHEDWRIRNSDSKSVEQQRKDTGNALLSRGAVLVAAVLAVAVKNLPDILSDFLNVALLSFALLIIAASVLVIFVGLRRRRNRKVGNDESTPYSGYAPNNAESHNYSEIIDSWDIKDPKPPWEL